MLFSLGQLWSRFCKLFSTKPTAKAEKKGDIEKEMNRPTYSFKVEYGKGLPSDAKPGDVITHYTDGTLREHPITITHVGP